MEEKKQKQIINETIQIEINNSNNIKVTKPSLKEDLKELHNLKKKVKLKDLDLTNTKKEDQIIESNDDRVFIPEKESNTKNDEIIKKHESKNVNKNINSKKNKK